MRFHLCVPTLLAHIRSGLCVMLRDALRPPARLEPPAREPRLGRMVERLPPREHAVRALQNWMEPAASPPTVMGTSTSQIQAIYVTAWWWGQLATTASPIRWPP